MSSQVSDDQIEIIQEFVQECIDLLDHLEPVIVGFGEFTRHGDFFPTEENMPILHEVFRLFHSIKGSAGFLNFSHMAATAHAAENLLDNIRKGELAMAARHVDLFCYTCDFMRSTLDQVATNYQDEQMAGAAAELTADLKESLSPAPPRTEAPAGEAADPETRAAVTAVAGDFEDMEPETGMMTPDETTAAPDLQLDLEMEVTPEMYAAFAQEAGEQLQELEQGLLNWSDKGADSETIGELFRKMHSFKGNCGFLNLADLEKLSHRMETVLDVAKAGAGSPQAKPADTLLNLCDILKETLTELTDGGPGKIDNLALYLELLDDLIPADWGTRPTRSAPAPRLGEILLAQGTIPEEVLEEALAAQTRPLGDILVEKGAVSSEEIDKALARQQAMGEGRPGLVTPAAASAAGRKRQDLRVDLEKIDTLINLIGEMVIAENMLINNPDLQGLELENFGKAAQQMNKIVKELQEVAMAIRMIPVAGLFNRMTRLAHDLSRKSGKKAELILTGTETEVDKTVIEQISDPLVHLIRNAMDHGLESPEQRRAAGKNETGTMRLTASHEEGEVQIRLEDDGRGLNRDKILAKARENELIVGDGSELSDREAAALIFMPGFSTADRITDVSGRGVGMDVVKQNLNQIKGKIDIDSQPGQGTRITLRVPLTMAILDGMMVGVGVSRYIIPTLSIRESFRPAPEAITINPDGLEMVRVRDHLFPVLRLHQLHGIETSITELEQGILILIEHQGRSVGLFVDEILGQQQTVIKGLSEYIGKIGQVSCVSGCTIMGNGDICLILDAGGLIEL